MKLHVLWIAALFISSSPAWAQTVSSQPGRTIQVPLTISECEGDQCPSGGDGKGMWSFHGIIGDAHWANGAVAKVVVEKFDEDGVLIRRIDQPGSTTFGVTAVYKGTVHGDRIEGTVVWSWSGHWDDTHPSGQWSGTMQGVARQLPALKMPEALTECEAYQCVPGHEGGCVWVFHGTEGKSDCHNHATAKFEVLQFDAEGIAIRRTDLQGGSYGLTGIYTGIMRGNKISGWGTWSWPGHWHERNPDGPWSATIRKTASTELPPAPPKLVSPEVHSDGSVTFRFVDPYSLEVILEMEGAKPVMMDEDENGVWTITTPPLQPDYYGYDFLDDNTTLSDPANPLILPNMLNPQKKSMVHVPGPASLPWEESDVPHGTIHHEFYKSAVIGEQRDMYVYTPPGYDPGAKTEYPVLYLLHGFGQESRGWDDVGFANRILDHLIAEGKAKPMLVVMPVAYGSKEILANNGSDFWNDAVRNKSFTQFTESLLTEVIPHIERVYRAKKDRNSRAIAGLSMGGAESLLTGLNHLDEFAWVGSFSSGGLRNNFDEEFPGLHSTENAKLRLLWVACGKDDSLIAINREFNKWLETKGVVHTEVETPGEHTWPVWRRNLATFAPLLFH